MTQPVLLALDVGNTNITLGAFRGGKLFRRGRLETDLRLSAGAFGKKILERSCLEKIRVDAVAYASVVPEIDAKLEKAVYERLGCKAVKITPKSPLGVRLRVKHPQEVGADRIVNALAAIRLFGAPAVVLDFGTATTFDCISRGGDYLGGAILPGPHLAARALSDYTAKLPLVPIAKPRRVVGRDTVECIQGGLYFGYLGMIEKVLGLTLREMQEPRARVLATGGLAGLFAADLPRGTAVVPDLTLEGIRIAFDIITNAT